MYQERIRARLEAHQAAIEGLRDQLILIERMARVMIDTLERGGRIYWLGNGGSAADSQHFAAELMGRFERDRAGLPSVALVTNVAVLTAISNDYGFERVFARQVETLCTDRDCLMALSTSGNSTNVTAAIQSAKSIGTAILGLTGYDGGQLTQLADHCLVVSARNTAIVQEAHSLICHILCDLVEDWFFGAGSPNPAGSSGVRTL